MYISCLQPKPHHDVLLAMFFKEVEKKLTHFRQKVNIPHNYGYIKNNIDIYVVITCPTTWRADSVVMCKQF